MQTYKETQKENEGTASGDILQVKLVCEKNTFATDNIPFCSLGKFWLIKSVVEANDQQPFHLQTCFLQTSFFQWVTSRVSTPDFHFQNLKIAINIFKNFI